MKRLILVLGVIFASGCEPAKSAAQELLSNLRGPLGNDQENVMPIKQVLFDFGSLMGTRVVIEGIVKEISPGGTYLVLQDITGFITVPIVNVVLPPVYLKAGRKIRIAGTVKYGHNQMPVLEAEKFSDRG